MTVFHEKLTHHSLNLLFSGNPLLGHLPTRTFSDPDIFCRTFIDTDIF